MSTLNPFSLSPIQYVKAIVAGLIAALAVLGTALDGGLTANEVIGVLSTFLVAAYGTFLAPNKAAVGAADPELSEQAADSGYLEDGLIVRICVLIIVVALTVYLLQHLF